MIKVSANAQVNSPSSHPQAGAVRRMTGGFSRPTVALTASVMFINFLPFYYFFPVSATVKFAFVTTIIFLSWLFAIREGILKSLSDNFTPYILFMAYYAYLIVSVVFKGEYVNNYLTYVGLIIMQPMIVFSSIMMRNHKKSYIYVITFMCTMFFLFISYVVFIQGERISVGYGFEISYQTINVYLGMFSVVLATWRFDSWLNRILSIIVISISVYIMFLAGGRGPVLAMFFSIFLYFILTYDNLYVKIVSALMIALTLMGFGSKLYSLLVETSFVSRMSIIVLSADDDSSMRLYLFGKAIELFKQNLIFGAGVGAFAPYINKYEAGWYPHNIFLEVAASLGIIGLFLFASYIFYVLYMFIKTYKKISKYNIQSFYLFIYILIVYQFSGDMVAAWIFYLALGMTLPEIQLRSSPRFRLVNA